MKPLRLGSMILAAAFTGLLGATASILSPWPNPFARWGRHLWAGGLANAALAALLVVVAAIPLRRGEKWAFWACLAPVAIYGLPVAILDTLFAPRDRLLATLGPQLAGLAAVAVGLALCAHDLFKEVASSSGNSGPGEG